MVGKKDLEKKVYNSYKIAREESGLPIVSEIMDVLQINEMTMDCIDIVQVGTRNFQNYSLLDELGKIDKPILLKRGTWGTIDEILAGGKNITWWK